jgi:hypothetical protein
MLNFERASKILEDHFANLTDEEFIANLKEYCPRVFANDKNLGETEQRSSVLETITSLRSQQSSFKTPQEIDAEILEEKSASSLNNEDDSMTLAKVLPGAR